MARIRIDDLPLGEDLTPEQEELILGAGRRTFRPMLESLENRDMMDAAIGPAVAIQMMPSVAQQAQVGVWEQQVAVLQNQYNQTAQLQAQQSQQFIEPAIHFIRTPQELDGLVLLLGVVNQQSAR